MLPKINGKSFLECTEEDLKILIDNPDFRENEYIDYKQNFAFLELPKGKERNEKIAEFKSDVCSFANAEGGYLIFGISDVEGCASELMGIEIDNTDRFELDRRNNLMAIQPKTPYVKFHFVQLENEKYIVILYIKHDSFSPYIHIEDEKNYKIYKRVGNRKQTMNYTELRNMFNQSLSLDKEIHNYRLDRINFYRGQEDDEDCTYSQFLLIHFIPETFIDASYTQNMLVLEKTRTVNFSTMFSPFYCGSWSMPCVDGLKFRYSSTMTEKTEGYIFNNGIVECFFPLHFSLNIGQTKYPKGYLAWKYIWEKIEDFYTNYVNVFKSINTGERVFICLSVIGCKDVVTEVTEYGFGYIGRIDRNVIECMPVVCEKINFEDAVDLSIKKLYVEFLISVGIKNDKMLNAFIKEIYDA